MRSFTNILQAMAADLAIIKERDPAARSTLEILLCYPGFHALVMHRMIEVFTWKASGPTMALLR